MPPFGGEHDSRNAAIYLAGLSASLIGTSAMTLTAGIWVKSLTGSSSLAALTSACLYAPALLAPVAGLLADRFARRRLLLAVNVFGAVNLLPLLLVHDAARAWLLPVAMAGYGLVLVLVDAAESALFTEIVPPDHRGALNGIRLSIQEGAKLVAPLAGAGLFALAGGGTVAAADAVTFLLAALALTLLRLSRTPPARRGTGPVRTELAAGVRHLRRTAELSRLIVAGALAMAASGVAVAAQYGVVHAVHRSPAFLGVLSALLGGGSVLAGVLAGRVLRRTGEVRLVLVGIAAGTAGFLLTATGWLPLVLAGWLVRGFSLPWVVIVALTALQRLTPDALQGRAAAALTFLFFAPQPITQAIGAALIGPLGYRGLYVLSAGLTMSAALVSRASTARAH